MGPLGEFKKMSFDTLKEGFEVEHDIHNEVMKNCKDEQSGILRF